MIKLSKLFSNGMVIAKNGKIYGTALPGETADCELAGKKYSAQAGSDGRFEITVDAEEYGGPYEMKIGSAVIRDVYVGRVWLCGGQSNMEIPINRVRMLLDEYIRDEPRIKMFIQKKEYAFDGEAREADGEWVSATGDALDGLFAVPYFFAQALLNRRQELSPDGREGSDCADGGRFRIGLVCAAAGGTTAEAWLPEEAVNKFPRHAKRLRPWKNAANVRRTEEEGSARVAEWTARLDKEEAAGRREGWSAMDGITGTDGFPAYGSVWLRKKVTLPDLPAKPAVLFLGRAVNSVTVFLNGRKVIEVGYQYPPCRGIIPPDAFKAGENEITVRLIGSGDHPRFIKGKPCELTYGDTKIDLRNGWQRRIGCEMPRLEPAYWFFEEPTAVYYTMLAPVIGYSVEGAVWYQGESNIHYPDDYAELFAAFVENLRNKNRRDLPVVFTQLARYDDPDDPGNVRFNAIREQQRKCLAIPGAAMIDAYDCGEWNDVHPLDKRTVGQKLAEHFY